MRRIDGSSMVRNKTKATFHAKEIIIVDDEPGVVVPVQFLMEQQVYPTS